MDETENYFTGIWRRVQRCIRSSSVTQESLISWGAGMRLLSMNGGAALRPEAHVSEVVGEYLNISVV